MSGKATADLTPAQERRVQISLAIASHLARVVELRRELAEMRNPTPDNERSCTDGLVQDR